MKRLSLAMAVLLSATVLATTAGATDYRACDVLDLAFCGAIPYAVDLSGTDINDACQVVGIATFPNEIKGVFVWQQGAMQDLGEFPGVVNYYQIAINEAGQVGGRQGVWTAGSLRVLQPPSGYDYLEIADINDAGVAAGYLHLPNGETRPFAWNSTNGFSILLVPPGSTYAETAAINIQGDVVGSSNVGGRSQACIWHDGAVEGMGTLPGSDDSFAYDINGSRTVVGYCQFRTTGRTQAFIWDRANGMRALTGAQPGTDSLAHSINDDGFVVGTAGYKPVFWEGGACRPLPLPTGYGSPGLLRVNNREWIVASAYPSGAEHGRRTLVWRPSPDTSSTVSEARKAYPWSVVRVSDAVITAGPEIAPGSAFASSSDRISGVRLATSQALQLGQRVEFTGTIKRLDGEYEIADALFEDIADGQPLQPLYMNLRSLANDRTETLNYAGVNTTGMLVRVAGKVTAKFTTTRFIYLDDGCGYEDGVSPPPYKLGIRVYIPPDVPIPPVGSRISVTGISRVKKHFLYTWSEVNEEWYPPESLIYVPSVWVRGAADITYY